MIVRSHFFGIEPTGVNPGCRVDSLWERFITLRLDLVQDCNVQKTFLSFRTAMICILFLRMSSKACSKSWPMVRYLMPYELNEIELMTAESGGQICIFYLRTHPILCLCRNSQTPLRRSQIALSGNISTVPGQQVSLAASISTRLGITCCHRPFALPRC